jgi:hypothetical protein
MEVIRNLYKISVGKPEEKRPARRLKHRWEEKIKIDHRERGFKDVDWIHLLQIQTGGWLL